MNSSLVAMTVFFVIVATGSFVGGVGALTAMVPAGIQILTAAKAVAEFPRFGKLRALFE